MSWKKCVFSTSCVPFFALLPKRLFVRLMTKNNFTPISNLWTDFPSFRVLQKASFWNHIKFSKYQISIWSEKPIVLFCVDVSFNHNSYIIFKTIFSTQCSQPSRLNETLHGVEEYWLNLLCFIIDLTRRNVSPYNHSRTSKPVIHATWILTKISGSF